MAGTTISGLTHPVLENDYASEWMGIEVLALGDGHATIRMTLRQEMLNGFGMAHGGMIFAFADSAFALACNPATPAPSSAGTPANTAGTAGAAADSITVASGVDINFLKPAFQGQVITAVADRRSIAGRSGLYDIQIFAADPGSPLPGELIAEFRGRSRTIPKKRN
jgi:acyl-CoA thioesterase